MKAADLRDWIDSLTQDIDFSYNGIPGSICPISRAEIHLCYGDAVVTAASVAEAMTAPFVDGQNLEALSEKLDI